MFKKTFTIVLALLIISMGVLALADEGIVSYGNEFKIDTTDDFNTGEELNNLKIENGSIKLDDVDEDGVYISQEIDVPAFEYMVVSWNSDTPKGTWIEVQAKVYVNHFDENGEETETWTDYLSWGQWSPFIRRASTDNEVKLAKISTDELLIKGRDGETASKVQLKVILHSENSSTPVVRMLHGTLRNTLEEQGIEKEFEGNIDESEIYRNLDTPKISQMIRDPKIANIICSPTTITMIMNGKGEKLLPEEVAQNTYDFNYGFGNWAFAMATAGSYGYEAYVDYTTIEGLKREIAEGYPVGVSVKYSNDPKKSSLPYIEGAPGITGGHLIVVTGFEKDGDTEYVLVNDSYAPDNDTVSRRYRLDQFEAAWSKNVAYIVHDKEAEAGNDHTERIDAEFVTTKNPSAFQIMVEGEIFNIDFFDGTVAYAEDNDEVDFSEIEYSYFEKYKNINNSLKFTGKELSAPLKVYVITDYGYVYVIKH